MRRRLHPFRSSVQAEIGILLLCGLAPCIAGAQQPSPSIMSFEKSFASPPADARPMMRWWWFGPAVVDSELDRELHAMQQGGIGGVEIQPVYPLSLDDPAHGIKNEPFLSPEFLASVHHANATAHSLGMRVDITLGSGWPYGGPGTTLALSSGKLKLIALPVTGSSLALPPAAEGDQLIAAFTAEGAPAHWQAEGAKRLDVTSEQTKIPVPQISGASTVLLFYASHTRQQVKRPSVGAEGFVLDHFARPAIDEHLRDVADKLDTAFGAQVPYSVFSDSLEVYGGDWTPNLPAEFERRRGYDLVAHLPELYAGGTPEAEAVRHDWGRTLSDLIRENYLQPIESWSRAHHTLFRSQTYGDPAVTLADEAVPSLPEGEGPQWRQFSYTRWASSASHLYNRTVTSAETFTWLHSPVFAATPLDMKVEADRMFLSGVNQIVGHGWPYTPPGVAEPGWNLYAAAVFDDHNPWYPVMPDVTRYLQRASWMLRQGKPVTDVAILLPEDDAQAAFRPGKVSVTDEMGKLISPSLVHAILDAGYTFDFVDAATLQALDKIAYPIIVLPPTQRMPLATVQMLAEYVAHGGHVIATGTLPSLAPGLQEARDSMKVRESMQRLFKAGNFPAVQAAAIAELPDALHGALLPDLVSSSLPDPAAAGNDVNAGLGFVHRNLRGQDLYFVVNSSSSPLTTSLTFRASHRSITVLSLDTGRAIAGKAGAGAFPVQLAPYESAVFLTSPGSLTSPERGFSADVPEAGGGSNSQLHWKISFPNSPAQPLESFVPWNALPGKSFFSGEATYTTSLNLKQPSTDRVFLDFGHAKPISDTRRPGSPGIHALVEQPIRDAAIVYVNGIRVGSLWHPPYRLNITSLLKAGENKIEVHVYNTAVNLMAGQPPRDYTALNAKYGKRFDPQDMDQIRSLPSGLLVAPTLVYLPSRSTVAQ
jgi:hypothetical protein